MVTTNPVGGTVTVLPLSGASEVTGVFVGPGGSIPLSGPGSPGGMLQTFPRAGAITSLLAQVNVSTAFSQIGITTLVAQLYTAPSFGGVATPVAGAACFLSPQLAGLVVPGTISTCANTGLNIAVAAGTTGFIVISASTTSALSVVITFDVSASLNVS